MFPSKVNRNKNPRPGTGGFPCFVSPVPSEPIIYLCLEERPCPERRRGVRFFFVFDRGLNASRENAVSLYSFLMIAAAFAASSALSRPMYRMNLVPITAPENPWRLIPAAASFSVSSAANSRPVLSLDPHRLYASGDIEAQRSGRMRSPHRPAVG